MRSMLYRDSRPKINSYADLDIKDWSNWGDDAPKYIIRRESERANVSPLEDLKTIFHERMNGIILPTLVTDEWREIFLGVVESVWPLSKMRTMRISIFQDVISWVTSSNTPMVHNIPTSVAR
ncbi:hypothetical protein N7516_008113, partial [Penicillium verrucosum]|uniref:uncharacterized protein n=1 Tax=Penicillium verrucosum TaxID=60171 RepID=UPI00254551DD